MDKDAYYRILDAYEGVVLREPLFAVESKLLNLTESPGEEGLMVELPTRQSFGRLAYCPEQVKQMRRPTLVESIVCAIRQARAPAP